MRQNIVQPAIVYRYYNIFEADGALKFKLVVFRLVPIEVTHFLIL